jgi:hypothetical protein
MSWGKLSLLASPRLTRLVRAQLAGSMKTDGKFRRVVRRSGHGEDNALAFGGVRVRASPNWIKPARRPPRRKRRGCGEGRQASRGTDMRLRWISFALCESLLMT